MKLKLLILIFVPLILSLMVASAYSGTDTIIPSDDVFVYINYPDKNYNYYPEWTRIHVTPYRRGWLKFTIPSDITIETAKLYLQQYDGSFPPDPVVTIHYSTNDSWTEDTITWNNQPSFGSAIDSETVSTPDAWYSWDVTSVVSPGDIVSFVLNTTTSGGNAFFCSKEFENPGKRPYLYISYEEKYDITILNVPLLFGEKFGISTGSAGLILTALFLFPLNMILVLWKKGGVIALILNFAFLGFFTSISWLPIWITVLLVLIVIALHGLKMKGVL